ncbi:MAG: metallophosphoesterase [Pirellulales bacterium]
MFWAGRFGAAFRRLSTLGLARLCGVVVVFCAASLRAETTTFAVIGDYGVDTPSSALVAAMVASWNPAFVVTVGDNTYGDQNINVEEWERRIGQHYGRFILGRGDNRYPSQTSATQRFFPSVGNHDVIDPPAGAVDPPPGPPFYTGSQNAIRPGYLDYFHIDPANAAGRLPVGNHEPRASYYDFRWGPAHFFALDSESAFVDSDSAEQQAEWLQTTAAASDAQWKFVYFHHSPYSSGAHGDQLYMQWPFAEWGISAVLTGHDHTYERVWRDGIPYFVNGLGGQGTYQFLNITAGSVERYNENHGAMRIAFDERSATFEFIAAVPNDDGSFAPIVVDRFSLAAVVPEPPASVTWTAAAVALRWRRLFRRAALG